MPHSSFTPSTTPSDPNPISWTYSILGSGIGASGLTAVDLDNDGLVEIIAGGSNTTFGENDFWHILEYSATERDYQRQWTSSIYSEKITRISAFDTDDDGFYSIFVGLENGDVVVVDGRTLNEIGAIASSEEAVNQIRLADIDNDGTDEIIVGHENTLNVYNADSFSLEYEIEYGASDFRVGNVDADAAAEIVLSSGLVLEFDGSTPVVEWDYGSAFGDSLGLSDIDSDGMAEIIGASPWYYITAFDADIQSPKWQINTDQDVDALLLADTDNDGIDEIIYGDGQWGAIYGYDAVTLEEEWQLDNPDHGVTNIAIADTDGDGALEILWGAGASSTGSDHLYVHNVETQEQDWQSHHIDGPFYATDVGDVDGDGHQDILFASFDSSSGYDDGVVFSYDAQTDELEWQSDSNAFGGRVLTGIHDLEIGDVDDDGVQDIVVGTDRLYDGAIYVFDGVTKDLKQSYSYDDGAPIYSLAIADVDNDGETEIIAGGGRSHTGAPGVYTYIIDGDTGVVEWNSISLGAYWSSVSEIEVANLDSDDALEIVAVNDNLYIFDGVSHQQWQSSFTGVTSVELYDIDNNGTTEILVGTDQGQLKVLNGQTYEEEASLSLGSSAIDGIQAYDVAQNGHTQVVFASAGTVGVYDIEQSAVVWQSQPLATTAGQYNSLEVANLDGDDAIEILVGTSYRMVELKVEVSDLFPADILEFGKNCLH